MLNILPTQRRALYKSCKKIKQNALPLGYVIPSRIYLTFLNKIKVSALQDVMKFDTEYLLISEYSTSKKK